MIIDFVRHGHPNYRDDCLTELGRLQAERAAERLCTFGIEAIYSSTKGRAMQTAESTAKRLGLPIVPCDFMREIGWASADGEPILENGHPWRVSDALAAAGESLADPNWREREPYARSVIVDSARVVTEGFDAFLLSLGYRREGEFYRVVGEDTDRRIAVFSHGGSSSVVLSHLLSIPLPQIFGSLHLDFTSITTVALSNTQGKLIYPHLVRANDAEHIKGIDTENVFGV